MRLGLQLDPRQRRGHMTPYVRGRLLPELIDLLRELAPTEKLRDELGKLSGTSLNLRDFYGVTSKEAARRWIQRHHALLMARRSGTGPRLDLAQAVEAYEAHLRAPRERPYAPSTIRGRVLAAQRVAAQLGPERYADTLRGEDLPAALAAIAARAKTPGTVGAARARGRSFALWLLDHGHAPLLSLEEIRRAFRAPDGGLAARVPPRWLGRDELAALVAELGDDERSLFVWVLLLCGPRVHSALELTWEQVDLDGRVVNFWSRKTKRTHTWRLAWSPSIEDALHELPRRGALVFDGLTTHKADRWLRATRRDGSRFVHPAGPLRRAVPGLKWKDLRSTCATYLHNASGIPGSTLEKAQALGHRVSTAERDYVNAACVVPREASTLEQAMGLSPLPEEGGARVIRLA